MKKNNKILYIFLTAIAVFFCFDIQAFAEDDQALYIDLCDIRKLFCGGSAVTIGAFVVFVIGISLFIGKFTWKTILTLLVGLTLFVSAEKFVKIIFTPPPGSDVVEQCKCSGI